MTGTRRLTIEILGDAKGVASAFGDVEKQTSGFGSKVGSAAKSVGLGILGIGGAALAIGPQVLSAGVELEAMGKKAETVFSDGTLKQVQSWADGVAKSFGLTSSQAVGLATDVGDLLKPMGFTTDQAADMSTGLVDLSGALSAWTGGTKSAADVSKILTKALLGEREGLKELGISITEADVQARLAAKGQEDLTGAALEQAKALATQELIFEKSTDAQKAWTDGSMDSVKAQNESKAALAQLSENFNRALYPALTAILPVLTEFVGWLAEKMPGFIDRAKPIITGLADAVVATFGFAKDAYDNVLKPTFEAVVAAIQLAWEYISPVLTAIGDGIKFTFEVAKTAYDTVLKPMWDASVLLVQGAWTVLEPVIAAIGAAVSAAFGVAKWAYDNVLSPIFAAIGGMIEAGWAVGKVAVGAIATGIAVTFGVAKFAYDNVFSPIFNTMKAVIEAGWAVAKPVIDTIGTVISGIFNGVKWVIDQVAGAIQGVVDKLTLAWDTAKEIYRWFKDRAGDFGTGLGLGFDMIPGFANGISNYTGGLAVVGERGPELVNLPRGASVMPAGDTMRHLGRSGPSIVAPITVYGAERRFVQDIEQMLRRLAEEGN